MDYRKIYPKIRRGIKTIVEYWDQIGNDEEPDDEIVMEDGIFYLIEDTSTEKWNYTNSLNIISDKVYVSLGYSSNKARILKEKLIGLTLKDSIDEEYLLKLLREFDKVFLCISDCDTYPIFLVQSLYALGMLESYKQIELSYLRMCIWYICSGYYGCPFFSIYKKLLKDSDFDFNEFGFMSPKEREEYSEYRMYESDENEEWEINENFEIYGCSVMVKFPNNKIYKYNCKFDWIDVDDMVYVSGKMKGIKGIVVEVNTFWDTSDYMEEIIEIVEDED